MSVLKGLFIFVRHGESESNVFWHNDDPDAYEKMQKMGDPGLTDMGRLQADCTARKLTGGLLEMGMPSVRVLSSQYERAVETAGVFVGMYRPRVSEMLVTTDLLEYTNPGKRLSALHLSEGLSHDGSWGDFRGRVVGFVEKYMLDKLDVPTVVFGHSMFISCLVSYLGSNGSFFPKRSEMYFRFGNCSLTTMLWDEVDGRWMADHVGSVAHLDDGLVTGVRTLFGKK